MEVQEKLKNQVLSREQMDNLKKLGVDTSDASMCWIRYDADGVVDDYVEINDEMCYEMACAVPCPTYTIGDLIEKLPKIIGDYRLLIDWDSEIVYYQDWSGEEVLDHIGEYSFTDRPIIDTLYDCLCWVAQNYKELLGVKK